MRPPKEILRDALKAHGCDPRETSDGLVSLCPAHDDHKPSLRVTVAKDGRLLLACRGGNGCTADQIVAKLGLAMRDLFPVTLGPIVATYDYTDESGAFLYQKTRHDPKDFRLRRKNSTGAWTWKLGNVRRVLYRLPHVVAAVKCGGTVYVAEGEKDSDTGSRIGIVATTDDAGAWTEGQNPKWRREHTQTLSGAACVVVLPDKDGPGRTRANYIAAQLDGKVRDLRVVEFPGGSVKDLSDWIANGGTRQELERLVSATPQWARATVANPTGPQMHRKLLKAPKPSRPARSCTLSTTVALIGASWCGLVTVKRPGRSSSPTSAPESLPRSPATMVSSAAGTTSWRLLLVATR
jgi:hypothetical protein